VTKLFVRAALVIGVCGLVLIAGIGALAWMAGRAVSNVFDLEPHGSLFVYSLQSGELTKIADEPAYALEWTPDGRSLWFTAAGHPSNRDYPVRELDVGTGEVADIFEIARGGYVSLAPSLGLIAYVRGTSPPLTARVIGVGDVESEFEDATSPKFTRDGALRFTRPSCGTQAVRYIANPVQPDSAQPAADEASSFNVDTDGDYSLSPDGRFLTYWKNSFSDVYLRDLTTGSELLLGAGFPAEAWSPDSSQFVFKHRPEGFGVVESQVLQFVRAADGAMLGRLDLRAVETHFELGSEDSNARDQELVVDVAWSPVADKIALAVTGGGPWHGPCGS
jgi:hypothetical protein